MPTRSNRTTWPLSSLIPICELLAVTGQLESADDRFALFDLAALVSLLDELALVEASEDDEDGEAQDMSTSTPLKDVVFISAGAVFVEALADAAFVSDEAFDCCCC